MAEPLALKYRAFISYSHADTSWAKWLHRGLESFHIDKDLAGRETATGLIPTALRPFDRDEFTAGHALTEQTRAALEASAALIVICSPSAAKSPYVNEEIRLFKARHAKWPVIPLIVAGRPDDHEREWVPPALKFKLDAKGRITKKAVETLPADAREEGDGKNLALAKVIAGLSARPLTMYSDAPSASSKTGTTYGQRPGSLLGVGSILLAGLAHVDHRPLATPPAVV